MFTICNTILGEIAINLYGSYTYINVALLQRVANRKQTRTDKLTIDIVGFVLGFLSIH